MEKINNYTPGPWTFRGPYNGDLGKDSFQFQVRPGIVNPGNPICTVILGGEDAMKCDEEHVKANAQLIALAPTLYEQHFKMLEALKKTESILSTPHECSPEISEQRWTALDLLRQTIKECEL